ncbi:MAG: ATPase [Gemmatimonadetes bacterium]|nr:MAG: ATPase [Gemmatimonadota bacterium]
MSAGSMARSYRPGRGPSRVPCVGLIPGPNYQDDIHAHQEADHVRTLIPGLALGVAVLLPAVAAAQAGHAKVKIAAPVKGATVSGPVKVVLQATGVEIVPATVERPGTGHHHLFVDHDLTPVDDTIPRGVTGIIHLGRGQTEFVLDSLKPGPHRVIAVVADWKHVPLKPLVVDTVRFTVK